MLTNINKTQVDSSKNRKTNNEESDQNSLHKSIIPVLVITKIIGFFPVQGIRGKNSSHLM